MSLATRPCNFRRSSPIRSLAGFVAFWTLISPSSDLSATDLEETRRLLLKGEYERCIQIASKAVDDRVFGEDWYLLKSEAEFLTGEYDAAFETISTGLTRYAWSLRLREAGIQPARMSSHLMQGAIWQTEMTEIVSRAAWRYNGDADSLVALGKIAATAGADSRQVLELFYDRALKITPAHRGALVAIGELALAKKDFALAVETFEVGVKAYPNDPEMHFGLARSIESTQPRLCAHHLSEALRLNPRHIGALLYKAEQDLDSEKYAQTLKTLDRVLAINELQPTAWAFHAVLAHLDNEPDNEKEYRETALKPWPANPAVDWLIGRKLSQKYRFAEGAEHQRMALTFDPDYQPARVQLAQDLLRLGQEEEGWSRCDVALKEDPYDVHLFNLVQLRDQMAAFTTIEADGFRIRMDAKESVIYGLDVLELLRRAKQTLCEKYSLELKELITVEIFPEPNDFAVRTFGLPGANGFLGVCFGRVITANSPASQKDHPSNWQAVLWHEFCHVVTLEKTHNRMPRWLSEGISVYEERLAGTTWGQRMNPVYRKRILNGGLASIHELSGSFLHPEKAEDLQFAYFQSSLLVEYLIEKYGLQSITQTLDDLAKGLHVTDAIERHTTSLDQIDMEFRDYAMEMARRLAPDVDWEQYDLSAIKDDDDPDRLERWVADHPSSIQGLTMLADQMVMRRDFLKAKKSLTRLIELYPEQTGLESAALTLAAIHRELNETDDERRVLEKFVTQTDDAKAAMFRLLELQTKADDWRAASMTIRRLLAINPLLAQIQKVRAATSERLGETDDAIKALDAWLLMDPDDPAEAHFRLAKLLHAKHDLRSKAHVLAALEVAPRFREAQRLLLTIVRETPVDNAQAGRSREDTNE